MTHRTITAQEAATIPLMTKGRKDTDGFIAAARTLKHGHALLWDLDGDVDAILQTQRLRMRLRGERHKRRFSVRMTADRKHVLITRQPSADGKEGEP